MPYITSLLRRLRLWRGEMFKPKYTITSEILNNLVKTAEAKAMLENAYLIPKWEVALRREALIRNAHASTAIEGNPLTLEQVSELAALVSTLYGRAVNHKY